ncbi:MAG: DUF2017 family protein [Actinomyces ruminicola]|uniref:Uncharacterized protein n=1 Tax=Actinomyces ruminicola TaxID=332524 RepID=A0A1G9ZIK4_9ACTO|nr:DUF2017 family protein [Actinomyces ruminicola]MBE6482162.1 DUF2017 family protein [Actinomyces ruminicola]SDN21292.1 protein of unknown function [Actinomyces ruminicola]
MRAFRPDPRGWTSALEAWEREYLAGLFKQIADLLAFDTPAAGNDADALTGLAAHGSGVGDSAPRHAGTRAGESPRDGDVLAALDFDPEPADDVEAGTPRAVPASLAPLLDVLLPDASEDPDVAVEIASLTRGRLRADKRSRLEDVVCELLEPTGPDGTVLVRAGQEGRWLGALNDARLVLAERLQIDTPEAAEQVHAAAWGEAPAEEGETARWNRAMALSYDMLSWWQESLVAVLLNGDGAA